MNLACMCCPAKTTIDKPPGSTLGAIIEASSYEPILMDDTSINWICPSCKNRLMPHIQAIAKMFGDAGNSVYWNGLKHLARKTEKEG
jgi:hypothetical protein